ncbi:MAG TPA: ribosome-associated translation inhibitor RaiA, partial [Anaerolineae bacterium]|nr:ribosome-associated translation inhibitor RaiA [Anaerolineae bacterium]
MQLIITGKNMEVSEPLKDYVQKKIGKLDRFLPMIGEVHVELSSEKVKSNQDRHVVQVTMNNDGTILRAEERSADILAAVDEVRDKLQRQIERFKDRPARRRQRARAAMPEPEAPVEEEAAAPRIVRTKQFNVTPMSDEEAIEQMELLGHDFFVFYNPTTASMNVLYRR